MKYYDMITYEDFQLRLSSVLDSSHYLKKSCIAYEHYTKELYECLTSLENVTNNAENNSFIKHKLQISQKSFNEKQYIQSACELTVMSYFIKGDEDKRYFIYENKVSPPKDVDFTFTKGNRSLNVEVKCPSYSNKLKPSENEISLRFTNRFPEKAQADQFVSNLMDKLDKHGLSAKLDKNMDNNMKDFLLSTQDKVISSKIEDFNVLVVSCNNEIDMMNWRGYLHNSNGFFTEESYVDHEEYNRVDFVLLTNLYNRHYKYYENNTIDKHWSLDKSFNLLYLNRYSKRTITKEDYAFVSSLFPNITVEFESYLKDENNLPEGESSPYFKENILGISFFIEAFGYKNRNYFTMKNATGELPQ